MKGTPVRSERGFFQTTRVFAVCGVFDGQQRGRYVPQSGEAFLLAQGQKRGYAFHMRRWYRLFCLFATGAIAVGIWIGVATVLGRAAVSETFRSDNEFAVRVKGCNVRIVPGTANKVEINRWRGSGMSQK